jgi:Amt family ammonium transporter
VTCQWFLFGFSLAFSETGGAFIGNFDHGALTGIGMNALSVAPAVPSVVFVLYQLMFATVTPAVIFGSVAERIRIIPGFSSV